MMVSYLSRTQVKSLGLKNCYVSSSHYSREALIKHATKCVLKGIKVCICVVIYIEQHDKYIYSEVAIDATRPIRLR